MTVNEALRNLSEVQLGYVRMVKYTDGGEATERTLDTYTTYELINTMDKTCYAYYFIGAYSYIIYKD